MKGKSRAVLTAGLGTVLSLAMGASAAAVTGLYVGNGSLELKGLVATVPLTFTCQSGGTYAGFWSIRQIAQQRTITEDEIYVGGSCTGERQTITVRFQPSPKPFKNGTALVEGYLVCDVVVDPETGETYSCGFANVMEEIRLR